MTDPSFTERDRRFLWHPFTQHAEWETYEPLIVERAEGFELIDVDFGWDTTRDIAVGLNYRLSPGLVLKAEHHTFRGYLVDHFVDVAGPPETGRYLLLSIAAAF